MNSYEWYLNLTKPSWAPPAWVFAPVWTFLYIIIFISFGYVFYKALTGKIPLIVIIPFLLNLIFNFAFTPIQFGLKNNILALFDIFLILVTLIWGLSFIWFNLPQLKWVVYVNIPYLLWVIFATILQITITYLNL